MDPATAASVEEWSEVPFSGGYEGLRDLADREFSGVVEKSGATLYAVNGRVVGIDGGTIEDFETGGTAREAPHHALPALYAMQSREDKDDGDGGVEVRGRYYTEETPIEDVDGTLQEGGFTGYLELSENVLSGDYYVVYQGGTSTSVAFIGNAPRVITDEEAFERACGEVGIYEVKAVDLDVIEVPREPEPPPGTSGNRSDEGSATGEEQGLGGAADGSADAPTLDDIGAVQGVSAGRDDPLGASGSEPDEEDSGSPDHRTIDTDAIRGELAERDRELDELRETLAATRTERERLRSTVDRLEARIEELESKMAGGGVTAGSGGTPGGSHAAGTGGADEPDGPDLSAADALSKTNLFVRYDSKSKPTLDDLETRDVDAEAVRENLRIEHHTQFDDEGATVDGQDFATWLTDRPEYRFVSWLTTELPFEIEATDSVSSMRKLYEAIPDLDRVALDAAIPDETGTELRSDGGTDEGVDDEGDGEESEAEAEESDGQDEGSDEEGPAGEPEDAAESDEPDDAAESDEPDDAAESDEPDDAAESDEPDDAAEADEATEPEEADEAAEPEEADEAAEPEEADETEKATEAGQPGEADGADDAVEVDAGDEVDRAAEATETGEATEAAGTAEAGEATGATEATGTAEAGAATGATEAGAATGATEAGAATGAAEAGAATGATEAGAATGAAGAESGDRVDEGPGQADGEEDTFDLVAYNRMGRPLVVADMETSRDPVTEPAMASLVNDATDLATSDGQLAGAFFVTESYFEPDALSIADDATGGSLLSRDRRKSYVKLSRSRGYHLCLVENRAGSFHLTVPEL